MTPREHLAAAKATLAEERDEIARLLTEAGKAAEMAVAFFEAGRHEDAMGQIERGCDLEFEALCNCEALGTLSEALYPEAKP